MALLTLLLTWLLTLLLTWLLTVLLTWLLTLALDLVLNLANHASPTQPLALVGVRPGHQHLVGDPPDVDAVAGAFLG